MSVCLRSFQTSLNSVFSASCDDSFQRRHILSTFLRVHLFTAITK